MKMKVVLERGNCFVWFFWGNTSKEAWHQPFDASYSFFVKKKAGVHPNALLKSRHSISILKDEVWEYTYNNRQHTQI